MDISEHKAGSDGSFFSDRIVVGVETNYEGERYFLFYGYGYYTGLPSANPYRWINYKTVDAPYEDVMREGVVSYFKNHCDEYTSYTHQIPDAQTLDFLYSCYLGNNWQILASSNLIKDIPDGIYAVSDFDYKIAVTENAEGKSAENSAEKTDA